MHVTGLILLYICAREVCFDDWWWWRDRTSYQAM